MAIINPSAVQASGLYDEPVVIVEEVREVDPIAGNCWLFVKSKIPSWPNTKNLVPNSIHPVVGGVVIMNFNGKPHYAYIPQKVEEDGIWVDHTNFGEDGYKHTFFTWEYLKSKEAKYWYVPDSS